MIRNILLFALFISALSTPQAQTTNTMLYKGINISGAEFNSNRKNAKHFKDYVWPSNKNLIAMKDFGFNTVRIPFAWERMQPMHFNPLSPAETKQLDRIVQKSHQLGLIVILDPHNYGKYRGKILKPNTLDLRSFADFWTKLADRYGKYPNVVFGLMNEPHKQSAHDWSKLAQAGIDAIRRTGSEQLILVPGTRWTGMHSWLNGGNQSNANALIHISDPLDNYAYEMHQYFDKDSSGTHSKTNQNCISVDKVKSKFTRTTDWLISNNKKAFLGEFGAQENDTCIAALNAALVYMQSNKSTWIGWSYWATGDWMANYPYNVFSKKVRSEKRLELLKVNTQ